MKKGLLQLQDSIALEGFSFGYEGPVSGEVVFATGMVGYPEAITDPSFEGQILVLTYPIIGSYGVPDKSFFESERIHISGLIVSTYNETPSHAASKETLSSWLKREKIPGLIIKDTRFLAQHIRDNGVQLGKIIFDKDIPYHDPNTENLVAKVSQKEVTTMGKGKKKIILFDCGVKRNIQRSLAKRNVEVITVPWDYDIFASSTKFDGILISNGPGDPKMADKTVATVRKALARKIPTLGICLGNQILCLAAGGDTYKLKFGHRSQNQPCVLENTEKCFITTQNHGFAVGKIPPGFRPWFMNANDGTNEGIIHKKYPFMSVQFHPEATPGPVDTEWIFDYFLQKV
jgi:carbamoyl-phosphate synthase small subunit